MNLSTDLRALQAASEAADQALVAARRTFETATAAYDQRRRYAPAGAETAAARAAWSLAALEWMGALIARETARDELASERRDVQRNNGKLAAEDLAAALLAAGASGTP